MNQGAQTYEKVAVESVIESASPHTLIKMLFEGAIARLKNAVSCMEGQQIERRSKLISSALSIIGGLQDSLDLERGGSLAENLDGLYDYMQRQLFRATVENDASLITEVAGLLELLNDGWSAMDLANVELPRVSNE